MAKPKRNKFLLRHKEKLKMNQYWYSSPTIETLVQDIQENATRCCFLSTPSLYFSLTVEKLMENSKLFDYDDMWADHPSFVKYDFHKPDEIPKEYHHKFDFVVIDPPYITEDVWALYAQAAKLLLVPEDLQDESKTVLGSNSGNNVGSEKKEDHKPSEDGFSLFPGHRTQAIPVMEPPNVVPNGKIMISTIPENHKFLFNLMNVRIMAYRPSIPNLIYQYSMYCNYPSDRLTQLNPEIDQTQGEISVNSMRKSKYGGMGSES